jgi:hypothetical protein
MLKKHPALVSFVILWIASFACVIPGVSAPAPALDPNAVNTSIAQTIVARQTEAVLNNPPTATYTHTPETPTLTLEPTLSATPEFTATPETPMISVEVDTNCRVGPGAIFERVGILLVGETAEIFGREPKGEYWYIRNPDADEGTDFCWVWGEYATVSGNTLPLLYLSPPPPPSSSFAASFEKLQTCGPYWVDFNLTNKSGALFKSISIILTDAETKPVTVVSLQTNGFTKNEGCGTPTKSETLIAGGTLTASSAPIGYNPSGHKLNAKITLCTLVNQTGTCVTQELNFTP